jgi:MFS family permease
MARTAIFVIFASAIWALLPVVAAHEIGSGSGGYGVLLGCMGAGAVLAATLFSRLRTMVDPDRIVIAGSVLYTIATFGLGFLSSFSVLCIAMVAGGAAWMTVMSTFNVTAQLALPGWVRARALSFYMFTFQASLALGSWLWGEVALWLGSRAALLISGIGLVAGLASVLHFRLSGFPEVDLTPSMHWPEPPVHPTFDPQRGPVLVEVEYRIDPARAQEFRDVMNTLGSTRRRDGAVRWGLFEDTEESGRYVESFIVDSWAEHMRQHERGTVADRELQLRANSFHLGGTPPVVKHLIAADD